MTASSTISRDCSPTNPLFATALDAAKEVGRAYRLTVDLQATLTTEVSEALVRMLLERCDGMLTSVWWRLSRTEYRMVVMHLLGHASRLHDDVAVRREVMSWLLPEDDRARLWTGVERRSVWSRAALGEALTVRNLYADLTSHVGESVCPPEVIGDEVAACVVARLVPYRPFLTGEEWDDAMYAALTGPDPWTDAVTARHVRAVLGTAKVAA